MDVQYVLLYSKFFSPTEDKHVKYLPVCFQHDIIGKSIGKIKAWSIYSLSEATQP